ncbi:MAG: hypothetical protein K2G01_00920 [Paramuribaculum sp.]|nr:hypothetical protein [Paramuribaculum sp.]
MTVVNRFLPGVLILAAAITPRITAHAQTTENISIEIFIDDDNGIDSSGITFSGIFGDNQFQLPLNDIPTGAHTISVRAKDNQENWSTTITLALYICDGSPDLSRIEYYVDSDPGTGKAIPITTDNPDKISFSIPTHDLTTGLHSMTLRGCDSFGRWATIFEAPFEISDASGFDEISWKMILDATRHGDRLILSGSNIESGCIVELFTLSGAAISKTAWTDINSPLAVPLAGTHGSVILIVTAPSGLRTIRKIH